MKNHGCFSYLYFLFAFPTLLIPLTCVLGEVWIPPPQRSVGSIGKDLVLHSDDNLETSGLDKSEGAECNSEREEPCSNGDYQDNGGENNDDADGISEQSQKFVLDQFHRERVKNIRSINVNINASTKTKGLESLIFSKLPRIGENFKLSDESQSNRSVTPSNPNIFSPVSLKKPILFNYGLFNPLPRQYSFLVPRLKMISPRRPFSLPHWSYFLKPTCRILFPNLRFPFACPKMSYLYFFLRLLPLTSFIERLYLSEFDMTRSTPFPQILGTLTSASKVPYASSVPKLWNIPPLLKFQILYSPQLQVRPYNLSASIASTFPELSSPIAHKLLQQTRFSKIRYRPAYPSKLYPLPFQNGLLYFQQIPSAYERTALLPRISFLRYLRTPDIINAYFLRRVSKAFPKVATISQSVIRTPFIFNAGTMSARNEKTINSKLQFQPLLPIEQNLSYANAFTVNVGNRSQRRLPLPQINSSIFRRAHSMTYGNSVNSCLFMNQNQRCKETEVQITVKGAIEDPIGIIIVPGIGKNIELINVKGINDLQCCNRCHKPRLHGINNDERNSIVTYP